ncbi:uncharacterized protein I303_105643 [Kwoniella dejecticola CBS 10117]|uniref:Zn(2)-C6 fungal-type domain-containing protein n=1 Tax=Kwoniella dejecticola CBS 10117 TaxID=1296121 RepID=A0AAJ8KRN7_9TREE
MPTSDPMQSAEETKRKPKRKRAAYSCTECTKAKAKCDRRQPCTRCVQRNVPANLSNTQRVNAQPSSPNAHESISPQVIADSSTEPRSRQRRGYVTGGRYYGPSAMSYVGDGSALDIMRALDVPDPETPENTQAGDKRPPRALVDILQELPPKSLCDELVRLYFLHINLVIHQLPLISIVLAISALSAPLHTLGIDSSLPLARSAEKRMAKANELFHCSRRASAYSDGLVQGRGDIMLVMSDLLTVRYLILVRRAPDALPSLGSAIFRAQALGLHRHGKLSGDVTADEAQERRLIWRIAEEVYQLTEPAYNVIESIDKELEQWAGSLPPLLSLRSYGQEDEFTYPHEAMQVHRQFATVEYNFARICLHRPYLTRPDPSRIYARSRQVCLQAALDDLWTRANFCTPGMENLSVGSYRVTNSLIILGITLLNNPTADTLKTINQCLASFVAARKGNSNLLDNVKIKEIAMIEVLRNKADSSLTTFNSPVGSPQRVQPDLTVSDPSNTIPTDPSGLSTDPTLQTMFDQFWGSQVTNDLYGEPFDNLGGERGGLSHENFNALMESLGAGQGGMWGTDGYIGATLLDDNA